MSFLKYNEVIDLNTLGVLWFTATIISVDAQIAPFFTSKSLSKLVA